eukprot:897343-Karenia_brevis.AAC.1
MLVDHLDRSPDKKLLRGKVGIVRSWVLAEEETSVSSDGGHTRVLSNVSKVVFVDFQTDDWQLPGLPPGLYPIFQTKR